MSRSSLVELSLLAPRIALEVSPEALYLTFQILKAFSEQPRLLLPTIKHLADLVEDGSLGMEQKMYLTAKNEVISIDTFRYKSRLHGQDEHVKPFAILEDSLTPYVIQAALLSHDFISDGKITVNEYGLRLALLNVIRNTKKELLLRHFWPKH